MNYRGCGIQEMRVLNFIASSHRTTVMAALPAPQELMASVSFDGWALPRSGVAFVWGMAEADATAPRERSADG